MTGRAGPDTPRTATTATSTPPSPLGLPGLVLVLAIFVAAPLRDVMRIEANGRADPLVTMFVQVWLFGLLLSCMESFFFDGGDPVWVTFLISVFSLRYLARFRSA